MSEWKNIADFLASLRKERIYYFPNPGNGGDALIAESTYQLFDRIKLDYQLWNDDAEIENATLIFGGGGNLVPEYTDASDFIGFHHARAKRLVLLPHSVSGHESLLAELGSNVHIFCREHRSYEHVMRFAPGANVYLAEDMALSLDLEELLGAPSPLSDAPGKNRKLARRTRRLHRRRRYSLWLADLGVGPGQSKQRIAYCFREDDEKTAIKRPFSNFDLSGNTPIDPTMRTRSLVIHSCREFIHYLAAFDKIETNRLHVAVGGALLGKEVSLYPNSYWKNRAVYEASLRDRFRNLHWADSFAGDEGVNPEK